MELAPPSEKNPRLSTPPPPRFARSPSPRSVSLRGGGQTKSFSRRCHTPELCERPSHEPSSSRIRFRQIKRERSAERRIQPMSAQRRRACTIGASHLPRGSALLSGRARLPALHCGLATGCCPDGSAPDPCFLGLGFGGCFARLAPVPVQRAPRGPVIVPDDGAPEPPGNGLQIRPQAPLPLRLSGLPSGKAPSNERDW